jgi:hypothetical protein
LRDEDLERRVRLFCDVAKVNNSVLSLSELLELLPDRKTETELEHAIKANPNLDSEYEISSGFIVERSGVPAAEQVERARREKARSNLISGAGISQLLATNQLRMMGISGSTSYRSASRSEDLDFFSVTEKQGLWVFLTRALIISRAIRHMRRSAPDVCLSCTVDSEYAERFFAATNGALFARDALSMVVLAGRDYYRYLIRRGSWMSSIYPRLYSARAGNRAPAIPREPGPPTSSRIVNRFLYATVGMYIRAKSFLHNRRFLKQGRTDSVFKLLVGEDHCIYESARYTKMRTMYEPLGGPEP